MGHFKFVRQKLLTCVCSFSFFKRKTNKTLSNEFEVCHPLYLFGRWYLDPTLSTELTKKTLSTIAHTLKPPTTSATSTTRILSTHLRKEFAFAAVPAPLTPNPLPMIGSPFPADLNLNPLQSPESKAEPINPARPSQSTLRQRHCVRQNARL